MSEVIVVIGAGSIGQAIARRVSAGKHVVLGDLHRANADAAAHVMLDAGFEVSSALIDVSSRDSVHELVQTATSFGDVTGVIHAAGVSPSQASPSVILAVDLYGTAVVLEEFGNVIAPRGAGVVIGGRVGGEVAQGVGGRLRVRRRRLAAIAQVVAHHAAPAGGEALAERVGPGEHRRPAREQDERCVLVTEGLDAQGDPIDVDGGHRNTTFDAPVSPPTDASSSALNSSAPSGVSPAAKPDISR